MSAGSRYSERSCVDPFVKRTYSWPSSPVAVPSTAGSSARIAEMLRDSTRSNEVMLLSLAMATVYSPSLNATVESFSNSAVAIADSLNQVNSPTRVTVSGAP